MATPSLSQLIIQQTKEQIYELALSIASSVGLDTTSWRAGDPTRSLYHVTSRMLESLESSVAGYIKSGFLLLAEDDWLDVVAEQGYGVTVPTATFATTTVLLTNAGGGLYSIDPLDLTFKASSTGKTYRNTSGGVLSPGPGTTLSLSVEAEESGSGSSAGIGVIDTMVTTLLGVTCSNTAVAVGVDKQSPETTKSQCLAKLDYLSPAKGAPTFVALSPDITGASSVTRARAFDNSTTGVVTVYVASPSGPVLGPDLALVNTAILDRTTPLCTTMQVLSATPVNVTVTYTLWIYKSVNKTTTQIAAEIDAALRTMFANRPIGGDVIPPSLTGSLYMSLVESTIRGVFPQAFRCDLTLPSSDVALANNQVAVLVSGAATINLVDDPK